MCAREYVLMCILHSRLVHTAASLYVTAYYISVNSSVHVSNNLLILYELVIVYCMH